MSELIAINALIKLVSECDFVLSGGDDPTDRCSRCGLTGVGTLRDALREAHAVLDHRRAVGPQSAESARIEMVRELREAIDAAIAAQKEEVSDE